MRMSKAMIPIPNSFPSPYTIIILLGDSRMGCNSLSQLLVMLLLVLLVLLELLGQHQVILRIQLEVRQVLKHTMAGRQFNSKEEGEHAWNEIKQLEFKTNQN